MPNGPIHAGTSFSADDKKRVMYAAGVLAFIIIVYMMYSIKSGTKQGNSKSASSDGMFSKLGLSSKKSKDTMKDQEDSSKGSSRNTDGDNNTSASNGGQQSDTKGILKGEKRSLDVEKRSLDVEKRSLGGDNTQTRHVNKLIDILNSA
jgi:hypothetical protein